MSETLCKYNRFLKGNTEDVDSSRNGYGAQLETQLGHLTTVSEDFHIFPQAIQANSRIVP